MARQHLFAVVRRLERVLSGFQSQTDEELLGRYVQTRDEPAFEALVWRQSALVWTICIRIVRNHHLAEEAFQDTFVALAANAAAIREVGPWLSTTARNAALAVRQRAARQRAAEPLIPDALPDKAPGDRPELREILLLELSRLHEKERRAIELHVVEGRTLDEVGAVLGLSPKGVHSLVRRTKLKLSDRLARHGIHDLGVFAGLAVGVAPTSVVAAAVRAALSRPAAAVGIAGASAHATAALSRLSVVAVGTAVVALAVAAVGLVWSPRVGGPSPAVEAKPLEPAVPAVRPEGLTARVVFSKDLPVGASGVAFGPNGRLALGGWMEPGTDGVKTAPGRIWNGNSAAEPVEAGPHGPGPVAFRADGTPVFLVLPSGERWSLLLWNGDRNEQLAEIPLPGRGAAQVRAALSADGTLAAATVASADDQTGHTLVWKLPTAAGEPVQPLHHWDHAATALAFSPKNEFIAVGHATGSVSVRTVADGREVSSAIRTGHAAVLAVAFGRNFWKRLAAPTGPNYLLAAGGKGGHLGVWDLSTGDKVQSLAGSSYDVHAVAFSPDGAQLASVGRSYPIVWCVASGREMIRLQHPQGGPIRNWMTGVAFSPDGHRLAITSVTKFGSIGGVDVVELRSGSASRQYHGLAGMVEKVSLSDGKRVAALAQNWHLAVWEAGSGRLEQVFEVEPGIAPDNSALRFVGADRIVFAAGSRAVLLDLAAGGEVAAWRLPAAGLNDHLAILPDGNVVLFQSERTAPPAWGMARGPLAHRVYDLVPGRPPRERYTVADISDPVSFATLSPDGRLLVIGGGGAKAYDGLSGQPIGDVLPPGEWYDGRFSENGERFLLNRSLGPNRHETAIVDPRSGSWVARHHPDTAFAVDDTNRLVIAVATNTQPNALFIARCGTATPLLWFDPDRRPGASHGYLSGDGRFVAWGRTDGTVCLADLRAIAPELFR